MHVACLAAGSWPPYLLSTYVAFLGDREQSSILFKLFSFFFLCLLESPLVVMNR